MAPSRQQSRPRFDLLRAPLLGQFLSWQHSRTVLQLLLFGLAVAVILDGLLGSPLAAKNVATVGAWVHYRGLVVLSLLIAGNLFCAACPFVLFNRIARWLGRPARRWPRRLRHKWLALAVFVAILFIYELFDLWASPWWTAWLVVAYFAAAFVLALFFTRDSFCLYLCPLGTFNFLYSSVSPLQIMARDLDMCRRCPGRECINGRAGQQGCQLELYVPTVQSNWNCTFCLDCAKACPYDNVALAGRVHGAELRRQSWPHRLDLALLAIVAAFTGLVNAFAMTPPAYALEEWLARLLHTEREALVLGLIYGAGVIAAPLLLAYAAAWLGRRLAGGDQRLNQAVWRHAYGFVPLGFAIWTAHYLFHFLTGALTLAPALQAFFARTLGWPLLGEPDWRIAGLFVPNLAAIQGGQVLMVGIGLAAAIALTRQAAGQSAATRHQAWRAALPWLLLLIALAAASVGVFLLPMEMRGSALGG